MKVENNYIIEIKRKLSLSEIESIFGTTDIGMLDCSDITDEEIDRIVEEFNNIPLVNPIRTEDLKKILND